MMSLLYCILQWNCKVEAGKTDKGFLSFSRGHTMLVKLKIFLMKRMKIMSSNLFYEGEVKDSLMDSSGGKKRKSCLTLSYQDSPALLSHVCFRPYFIPSYIVTSNFPHWNHGCLLHISISVLNKVLFGLWI